MAFRSRALVVAAALLLSATAPADAADDLFSGTYEVTGVTTDLRTGESRKISGHVVLTKRGAVYRAASQLATDYPTSGGTVHADVIGTGEGRIEGDVLEGTSHVQLVLQRVPGIDTNFAFVPREVGPRIVSTFTARFDRDNALLVELSNRPEKGEQYAATTTKLRGTRVAIPGQEQETPAP
ncbi:MAG: hypothetical protein IT386_05675 [Deltaproteobacteria bacterium]|nr:hypothetical protein [Deltaproteobacteria bacterium]